MQSNSNLGNPSTKKNKKQNTLKIIVLLLLTSQYKFCHTTTQNNQDFNLIHSMYRRCVAVINVNGGHSRN